MRDVRSYFQKRAPLLALAAFLGTAFSWTSEPARTDDLQGLKGALAGTELSVGAIAWEPSRGRIIDFFLGRPLLFEAAPSTPQGGHHDIFRAFVRLSPEGRVLDVRDRRNLTQTRIADEHDLGANGALAWFGTEGSASPESVTFLDLDGESPPAAHRSFLDAVQLGVSRLLETGTWNGIGRTDLFSEAGPLSITIEDGIAIRGDGISEALPRKSLFSKDDLPPTHPKLRLLPRTREPQNWLHWGADVGRHIFGTGAVAWAEGRAFSLWDNLHQVGYSVSAKAPISAKPTPVVQNHRAQVWPPEDIFENAGPDGKWVRVENDLLSKTEPPLFYKTVLHPDKERPYAELHLVAFDMRRLELGIGAGYEDPHPDTGPPGSGQIPNDVGPRVVATFNGAFKSVHGQYGMKAEGRLLVEPNEGAATVGIDESGSVGMGTWTEKTETSSWVAFRQNLDPLVADGKPNPTGRRVWGDHLYGSGVAVERSALCHHASGQLIYAWGTEITGQGLAEALSKAGCQYAIHLDMNPGHCAFTFNKVESIDPLVARGRPLDSRMRINPTRFIRWSPKDFFYLATRTGTPKNGSVSWTKAEGELPPPASIVGILHGRKEVGSLVIDFDRVESDRLAFSLISGTSEAEHQKADQPESVKEEALIAWGLGHSTRGHRTGLSMGKDVVVPLHRNYASLLVKDGRLALLAPAEPQTEKEGVQIAQLPALAREGELLPRAKELGGKRHRAAMCLDATGTLLVARMEHDTPAPLAQALLDLGCRLVVEMDRGSHPPPLVQRRGTETPLDAPREQTLLLGTALPMKPRTHLF